MPFQFPKELPTGADDLRALRDTATTAFHEFYDEHPHPTENDLEQLQYIVNGVEEIDGKLTALEEGAQRESEAKSLADRLAATRVAEDAPTEDTTSDNDGDAADTAEDTSTEPEQPAEEPTPEEEAPAAQVAASGKRRTTFSRAAHPPKDVPPRTTGWRLTSAAKNYQDGIVDTLKVAQEFTNLAHGRAARMLTGGGRSETTLAYLDREAPDEFSIGDQADAIRVLDEVTREARLPGGSLTAAGGWCAPSETVYDFLPTPAPADLLSLPEVTIRRGGVKFPVEPDFGKIYEEIGFHQTEAQAQAKTEKTCWEVPCGDWEELRLDVQGVCITGGILQEKAWPELTQKYVEEALRLHQHKINAWRIGKIVAGSTTVTGLTGLFGTAGAVLAALELQVADLRARHRIPSTQSVEGIAPTWLINILRADLALRDEVLPQQVTDTDVKQHFRNLGANLQFVADWQNDTIGGDSPATAWPATVDVILYPSGTWYSAVEPVINLGVTYDAALLKTNQAIQMFTEDGVAVGKRGPESRKVTIPVTVNGEVGARHTAA